MENVWVPIVTTLVQAGAPVNAVDAQLRTPLHWASFIGHAEVVELLLRHGADVMLEDISGYTAISLAKEAEVQELLQSAVVEASNRRYHDWLDHQVEEGDIMSEAKVLEALERAISRQEGGFVPH